MHVFKNLVMLLQVLISCKLMEENTQRDHGSKTQEWGSKESKRGQKEGKCSVWRPQAPSGCHYKLVAPQARPWAPPWRHSAATKISFANLGFLHPIYLYKLSNTPKPLSKPHLRENKVAMLGFTQNLSNSLIPLPFPWDFTSNLPYFLLLLHFLFHFHQPSPSHPTLWQPLLG